MKKTSAFTQLLASGVAGAALALAQAVAAPDTNSSVTTDATSTTGASSTTNPTSTAGSNPSGNPAPGETSPNATGNSTRAGSASSNDAAGATSSGQSSDTSGVATNSLNGVDYAPEGSGHQDRFYKHFRELQERMDQLFQDAWDSTGKDLGMPMSATGMPGFSSSVKTWVKDGQFIAWVYLPERDAKNVEAKVENGNILRITAKEEHRVGGSSTTSSNSNESGSQPNPQSSAGNTSGVSGASGHSNSGASSGNRSEYEMSQYEQLIALPQAVDASKLHIDREGSSVTITIPLQNGGSNAQG